MSAIVSHSRSDVEATESTPGMRVESGAESLLSASIDRWTDHLPLSPRECEIARLVARDFSNKRIARTLGISVWTVSTHLRRIFLKLGVHTKAGMVARVLDELARERASAHRIEPPPAGAEPDQAPPAAMIGIRDDDRRDARLPEPGAARRARRVP